MTRTKRARRQPVIVTTMEVLERLCAVVEPKLVDHDHIKHAAHYAYGHADGGHDLERWIIEAPARPTSEQCAVLGLPIDAEYGTGHIFNGKQRWVFTAKRPFSPEICERCSANASARLFALRGLS